MWYSLIFKRLDLGNLEDFLNLILVLSYVGIKFILPQTGGVSNIHRS
jgi:hypothetical protein